MAAIVDLIGYSMGGRPAEYLMGRLGMPVSDDTILRQIKRRTSTSSLDADIKVVGIDDWSWWRSTRYGTIMVDLERRAVVDVLDDRSCGVMPKMSGQTRRRPWFRFQTLSGILTLAMSSLPTSSLHCASSRAAC